MAPKGAVPAYTYKSNNVDVAAADVGCAFCVAVGRLSSPVSFSLDQQGVESRELNSAQTFGPSEGAPAKGRPNPVIPTALKMGAVSQGLSYNGNGKSTGFWHR